MWGKADQLMTVRAGRMVRARIHGRNKAGCLHRKHAKPAKPHQRPMVHG